MASRPHNERSTDALFVPLVDAVAIQPNALIWQAFNDPDVSEADFAALVRSIHGADPEEC